MPKITKMQDVVRDDEVFHVTITVHSERSGNSRKACDFLIGQKQLINHDYSPGRLHRYINDITTEYDDKFNEEGCYIETTIDGLMLFGGDSEIMGGEVAVKVRPKGMPLKAIIKLALEVTLEWAKLEQPPF